MRSLKSESVMSDKDKLTVPPGKILMEESTVIFPADKISIVLAINIYKGKHTYTCKTLSYSFGLMPNI